MVWHATQGGGAFLNGKRIAANQDVELSQALLATGFSYLDGNREVQRKFIAELLPDIRDIRRNGAAAVDLCFVASGFVDGYFEIGLYEWDLAAGGLIAREAGASVSGRRGGAAGVEMTIAAGRGLHEALIARIG
jgi:myo-inositol-1(or 4)-monophosphatase